MPGEIIRRADEAIDSAVKQLFSARKNLKGRRIALAVDAVVGVVEITLGSLEALPLLFQDANRDVISAIGTLDADLLLVLRSTRLISEEFWALLEAGCALA